MQDFIGQPILKGSWLATGGKGNTSCEYGMVLALVKKIDGDKLKLVRLSVSYPDHKTAEAKARKVTASNPNKWVVVNPPPAAAMLFERVVNGTATPTDHRTCGLWLHGAETGIWA